MSTRARVLGFGSAALLVAGGAASAVLVAGGTGELLALALMGLGFLAATCLVFLEIGLSEDRERVRDRERPRAAMPAHVEPPRLPRLRRRRR
jgi:hypothetical protein